VCAHRLTPLSEVSIRPPTAPDQVSDHLTTCAACSFEPEITWLLYSGFPLPYTLRTVLFPSSRFPATTRQFSLFSFDLSRLFSSLLPLVLSLSAPDLNPVFPSSAPMLPSHYFPISSLCFTVLYFRPFVSSLSSWLLFYFSVFSFTSSFVRIPLVLFVHPVLPTSW